MSILYIVIGLHFSTLIFLKIMPPYIPFHIEMVYISGFFEYLAFFYCLKIKISLCWNYHIINCCFPANIYIYQTLNGVNHKHLQDYVFKFFNFNSLLIEKSSFKYSLVCSLIFVPTSFIF